MLAAVKESLKQQSECPSCHVSWKAIEDMLHDGKGSDNYSLAQCIIENCPVCGERF